MLDTTILPLPTPTSTPPLSPTLMSRSPPSPTSTRSPFPLLPLLPPLLPTMLPLLLLTLDTPSLPPLLPTTMPLPLLTPTTPLLPLPTLLELMLLAFPTMVKLFHHFSRLETSAPLPPIKCPAKDAATFDSMRADLLQLQARQPVTMNPFK